MGLTPRPTPIAKPAAGPPSAAATQIVSNFQAPPPPGPPPMQGPTRAPSSNPPPADFPAGSASGSQVAAMPVLANRSAPQMATNGRFELEQSGQTAWLEYNLVGGVLQLIHTEVPEALRGKGIAGQLAQCRISADPGTYMLVTYGRSGAVIPVLTGKITASGRRPWLGLKLPLLFRNP